MSAKKAVKSPLDITLKKWSGKPGNLIMILHDVQDHHGYVGWDTAKEIGRRTGVPLARIYEVLTFYNYFKIEKPGDYVISVCTGTACHLKKANQLIEAFSERLHVGDGESTPDQKFHLQSVRCLGCCGLAPVVTVNERVHGKLTVQDVDRVLTDLPELTRHAEEVES